MTVLPGLARFLKNASLFIVLTGLLFLIVNLAAYVWLMRIRVKRPAVSVGEHFMSPLSPRGFELVRELHPGLEESTLRSLLEADPGIRPHTVLAFTEGLSTEHYQIGLEGIRYEPGWSHEFVRDLLQQEQQQTYVFGGSTAFGYGVMGDQTVAGQLNQSGRQGTAFNFGVEAFDSIRETDKLLYLLRKGYRPAKVIFIDGLNDVTTFAWSPYRDQDKPRTQGLLIDRGQVPLIFGYPMRNNMLSAFSFSLPVIQLVRRMQSESAQIPRESPVSPNTQPMDWSMLLFYYHHWDTIWEERAGELADELVGYYRANIAFLRGLEEAFGFQTLFVYQPIGLLDESNPFIQPEFGGSAVQHIFRSVDSAVRDAIAEGTLPMVDCSGALSRLGAGRGYLDAAHYSPAGNRALAECVMESDVTGPEKAAPSEPMLDASAREKPGLQE